MNKISCINCGKVITVRSLKYNDEEVRKKVKIVFGDDASSNLTETNQLCCFCHSTFNTFFNAKATFNNRAHPDSKINALIKHEKQNQNTTASSSRIGNHIEIETINLEDENEENDYILPLIDDKDQDEQMSIEVICLSDDSSNEFPVPPIEFQEKFVQLKIEKLPNTPSLTTLNSFNSSNFIKHCCLDCGRLFSSAELLEGHQNVVHNEKAEKRFKCNFCERGFFHQWFYKNHLDTCHNGIEILFSCAICNKQFRTQNELDVHKKTHRCPLKCKYCHKSYEYVYEVKLLRKHMIEAHGNSAEAKAAAFNEKYIKERAEARKLKQTDHRPCFECDRSFENKFACFVHVIYDHYNQTKCPVCKQEFMCSNDLKMHVDVTGHELNFCTFCDEKFGDILKLLKHMYTIHSKNIKFPFICESCGKGFRFFDNLLLHYKRHVKNAGPPSYICTEKECGKKFVMKHNFKTHMARHKSKPVTVNPEKIKCNICKKSFKSLSDFNFHNSKVHDVFTIDVSVLHKCPDCEFSCRSTTGLSAHRRTHCAINGKKKDLQKKKGDDSQYIEVVQSEGQNGASNRNSCKYKCAKCGDLMTTLHHIFLHLYTEHSVVLPGFKKQKYLKCKTRNCPKIFINQAELRKHASEVHPRVKPLQFTCLLCVSSDKLNGVEEMRNHFKTVHPDSQEADHAAKNEQRTQLDSATNEKQRTSSQTDIYCLYCKMIFTSIIETDDHNKTVHKAQPVCKLCQHVSEDEISYQNHVATHSEFPCLPCNAVFSSMKDFCNHLTYSHKRHPYICEICGLYISTLEILMKHYKMKHNGK